MQEIVRIFKEIQANSSKNDKKAIISANADNQLFRECLVFLLDGNVTTGIKKSSLKKRVVDIGEYYNNWSDFMKYIATNNTGRDLDISIAQNTIRTLADTEEEKAFCEGMITKTLRLGCDKKTVNAVIPNLIPTWDVMLGSPKNKLRLKKDEKIFLSHKLNGNRGSYNGNGKLLSRQGKEFKGLEHVIEDIYKAGLKDFFVDGELIRKNVDGVSDGENFRIGTGIINSDGSNKEEISFVIFDLFPAYELESKESSAKYSQRKLDLLELKDTINRLGLKHIDVVEMVYEGTDHSVLDDKLAEADAKGWEGLMLNKDAVYKCKRSTDLIKLKTFFTCDLEVLDVVEGDGRLKGTFGALICKYKDNTVNVGSGYDDSTRSYIWQNREDVIGKIVEIKYKEESENKDTGLKSLQFPVFVGFRNDKTEESYN